MTTGNNVAVAMSGGVDSSMAAYYLKAQGCTVFGITGVMWGKGDVGAHEVVKDARRACAQLSIDYFTIDLRAEFERNVLRYFKSEYLEGRTPSPCVLCNSRIKFGVLLDAALDKGADRLATGHYARSRRGEDAIMHLFKGVDESKDQSYFLFDLNQGQLENSVFPLGDTTKAEVRKDAAAIGLDSRRSRESNELCFIPDQDYVRWIEARAGKEAFKTGRIVDAEGRKLGLHGGVHRYTVGQRKGLGIATGSPMYVASIDGCTGEVVVGQRDRALTRSMAVTDINWIGGPPEDRVFEAEVKIRYNHGGARCSVEIEDGLAHVTFDEPQFAVTPGQVAVFYDGLEVIGGGFIRGRQRVTG